MEILEALVEASRRLPRERREDFWYVHLMGDHRAIIQGGGIVDHLPALFSDLEILESAGFIGIRPERNGAGTFYITPLGFRQYAESKAKAGAAGERVEKHVKSYLASQRIDQKYRLAFAKWVQAESLLWSADATANCRLWGISAAKQCRSLQLRLVRRHLLARRQTQLLASVPPLANLSGETDRAFLDALLAYWGTLSDLVMRLEHGGQKEGAQLVWEDARRVVFQTAIVMFEIATALEHRSAA